MKTSYLFLAPGFEEIEALSVIDILRRAGLDVKTVAVHESLEVAGAHGITVKADLPLEGQDFSNASWLIVPGGMPGASNIAANNKVCDALKAQAAKGGNIAAICAAPAVVLAPLGIIRGKQATCYPGFEEQCESGGAIIESSPVVNLGNIITANGPASAMAFALTIVSNELGEPIAQQVGSGMLFFPRQVNLFID